MKRLNLRDVPDDVCAALAEAAEDGRQSLNAFVVDRLAEVARAVRLADHLDAYPAPVAAEILPRFQGRLPHVGACQ